MRASHSLPNGVGQWLWGGTDNAEHGGATVRAPPSAGKRCLADVHHTYFWLNILPKNYTSFRYRFTFEVCGRQRRINSCTELSYYLIIVTLFCHQCDYGTV